MAEDGCPICQPFDKQIFTLDTARGFIPVHHNCRCTFAPVIQVDEKVSLPDAPSFVPLNRSQSDLLSENILQNARTAEVGITKTLQSIIPKHNGALQDLDFRVKTPSSLVRKIQKESAEMGWDAAQVVQHNLMDVVRYTVVIDDAAYASSVTRVIDDLVAQGIRPLVRDGQPFIKNYWPTEKYRGINAVFVGKNGQRFELQFHTPKSFATKDPSHKLYNVSRALEDGNPVKAQKIEQMKALWREVETPTGIQGIGVDMSVAT